MDKTNESGHVPKGYLRSFGPHLVAAVALVLLLMLSHHGDHGLRGLVSNTPSKGLDHDSTLDSLARQPAVNDIEIESTPSPITALDKNPNCDVQMKISLKKPSSATDLTPLTKNFFGNSCGKPGRHGAPVSFVVTHSNNEGSHFITEQIQQRFACSRIENSEGFDVRHFQTTYQHRREDQSAVLRRFFSLKTSEFLPTRALLDGYYTSKSGEYNIDLVSLRIGQALFGTPRDLHKDFGKVFKSYFGNPSASSIPSLAAKFEKINEVQVKAFAEKCDGHEIRGALVRITVEQWCDLNTLLLITVRTDLMRFSLAAYQSNVHSQFLGSPRVKRKVYDLEKLRKAAKRIVDTWRSIAQNIVEAKKCGVVPYLLRYEEWVSQTDQSIEKLRMHLEKCGGIKVRERSEAERNEFLLEHPVCVHKAHSNNISVFVENAEEVETMFREGKFPTFDQIAHDVFRTHHLDYDI